MFSFLAIIGVIGSIILFGSMVSSDFKDTSITTSFVSMLFSTILCFKLAKMDKQINDNEAEIKNLKKHLGINNNNGSDDIVKYYPDRTNNSDSNEKTGD